MPYIEEVCYEKLNFGSHLGSYDKEHKPRPPEFHSPHLPKLRRVETGRLLALVHNRQ
jgi:hypothetical protein